MEKSEVFNLTDLVTITEAYRTRMEQANQAEMAHSLFTKGIYEGMEILAEAIAMSITARALLISESEAPIG